MSARTDVEPVGPAGAPARVFLVCSPGGHLQQMLALRSAWADLPHVWVSLESPDAQSLLRDERVIYARGPTNRNVPNLLRNLWIAWRSLRRHRPEAILSTGAALAVPYFLAGKLLGCRLVYVESLTRTRSLSMSGRIVRPLADEFFVQWPDVPRRGRMRFEGRVL